ncbi:MAG: hypothetical protein KKI12_07265 [Proteobacteria bacterium]|nr:hypothetical protein [Pseudomonadota bacterium]MBU4287952.1 hypothetical protein [Pseudomonadota bacterium]MBU4413808.1 hypothetical protein [Pseudomonadota bacterium]MCG2758184.1 hypothetical protein [Desulfobacteraceae bacterium]
MRKFKIGFWAIVFGLIGIVVFQNQDFFMAKQILGIDLIFTKYETPELHRAILFAGIFLIGFIISYIFTLINRLKFRKVVKSLGATIDSQNEDITSLINELESLKGGSSGNNKENEEEKEQKSV